MGDSKPKSWTEAEKLGLLFQIIEHGGPIPWADLNLPEGRTKKACTVMLDRERQKYKKALAEEKGIEITTKKRGLDQGDDDSDDVPSKSKKKAKVSKARSKKAKAMEEQEDEDENGIVKSEPDFD